MRAAVYLSKIKLVLLGVEYLSFGARLRIEDRCMEGNMAVDSKEQGVSGVLAPGIRGFFEGLCCR